MAPQTRTHSPVPEPSPKPERVTRGEEYEDDTDEGDEHTPESASDPTKTTFERRISIREKGKTKGKIDIYLYTQDGRVLRSKRETAEYCRKHRIIIKVDQLKELFSTHNKFIGYIEFPRNPLRDSESETSENEDPEEDLIEETNCVEVTIPRTPKEAYRLPEAGEWRKAMQEELQTMEERTVWTPVPKPSSSKLIGTKWVYTLKRKGATPHVKFKARLVALGNNQTEGRDYNETYSPVVNFTLIRLFIALFVCVLNWRTSLLDVKCAYLYGNIDKEIYIKKPSGYVVETPPNCEVLKLNKALYGLHQSGKCWYEELHHKLISNKFKELKGLTCVYTYGKTAVLLVYVDDLILFSENKSVEENMIQLIQSLYQVEYLGPITKLLGIEFSIDESNVRVNCPRYIASCLAKFDLSQEKVQLPIPPGVITSKREQPTNDEIMRKMTHVPYRSLLGCLLYISGRCRPDISFSVAALSQMVENPSPVHWSRLTKVLQYLNTTSEEGLIMRYQQTPVQLTVYADASWASDPDTRRSWSGYSIFLNGNPVTWRVIKQTCVALSPMEAEFIATTEAVKDMKYLQSAISLVLNEVAVETPCQKPILLCDNSAAIHFIKNRVENIRNRYIDLKYMFIRELHERGYFDINHVRSAENLADILTKPLSKQVFRYLKKSYIQ